MKVLIIEGPDNCGKDTLINNIASKYNIVKHIHCDKPKDTDPHLAIMEQSELFHRLAYIVNNDYRNRLEDIAIFNRYHYGEYIYGQIYRHENDFEIVSMIRSVDKELNLSINPEDICYIQLMADNEDFLFRNDDGLSLSGNKKELIRKECELFKKIFEKSDIQNKHLVYVNNGDKFRSKEELVNEVMSYINFEM